MRFKLEKEDAPGKDCSNAPRYVITTKVRVNSETTVSLPTTSYVIIDEPRDQRLIVIDHSCGTQKVLNGLSQGLQLKLEKVGDDNKLALVTDSSEYYYYYHDGNIINIATIDFIPQSRKNGEYVHVYDYDTRSIKFKPLESSKVLIDPKDVISSKNMSLIGSRLDIRIGDNVFKESQYEYKFYKSVEIHNSTGSKVGMLNNVVPIFDWRSDDFKLFPFHEIKRLNVKNSYFATEKLGSNYVGCISDENGEYKNFYSLNPNSFGYKYDHNLALYPYYYNLENFGNFLEVDVVNTREFEDLKAEVQYLKEQIEQLKHREQVEGMPRLPGFPGPRVEPGSDAKPEDVAAILLSSEVDRFEKALFNTPITKLKGKTLENYVTQDLSKDIANDKNFRKSIKGEKGDQGLRGEVGSPGPQGLRGEKGYPSPRGDKGWTGLNGLPGEKGDKGDQGYLGYGYPSQKGDPGAPGSPGLDGMPGGPKGDRGETGLKGSKGDIGPQGPKGKQGDLGLKGLQGPSGAKGEKGNEGSSGPKGLRDWKGESGLQGKAGKDGTPGSKGADGAPGLRGPVGPRGFNGTQGVQGEKGDIGPKGDTGAQGIQGPKGINGTQGPSGLKGEPGLDGAEGRAGRDDRDDTEGQDGAPGPQGTPDIDGLKGGIGSQGLRGDQGDKGDVGLPDMPGPQGLAGPKGNMGNKGEIGAPGIPGPEGLVGPRGFNGTQGEKGAQGRVGPKGNTGAPGPKGSKGEDGVGAAEADQFLRKMNQTKIEIQNAKKAAEDAKSASEKSAQKAQDAEGKVTKLHAEVVNSTKKAETFNKAAQRFAGQALQSKQNTEQLYSSTKDIFCKTSPAEQVCTARRRKREAQILNDQSVTSGAGRPSSWINVFANTIVGAITGAFQPVSSFKPAIGFNNSQPSKAITTQDIDINGTLSLLDVFIRKITGQKHISTADQPALSLEELECYASYITIEFEEVLKYAAVKSGISVKNLNFNPVSVQSAIFQHINNGQYSKIPKSLYSFAKGACPDYKQTDKFLAIFKDHMTPVAD